MTDRPTLLAVAGAAAMWLASTPVLAQAGAAPAPVPTGPAAPGTDSAAPVAPSGPPTSTTTVYPYGLPAPGTDLNPGLPSSSRPVTDTAGSRDGFDLNSPSDQGGQVARGRANSPATITGAVSVPSVHTVRRGDTLWDLCQRYYHNPWKWPQVWAQNPQIQNPHWIYPGDQVRMRTGAAQGRATLFGTGGFGGGGGAVPPNTVFLRDQGFIGDPNRDVWGRVIGAREDQMMLSEGNHVYLQMRPGVELQIGQDLTIFRRVRLPKAVKGARQPPGELVAIKGTVRVDQWNPKTRIARGNVVESLDVIERGAGVGPVGRRFDVIPARPNQKAVRARVLTSIYPHVYMGQNQVVFIDRGSEDGLVAGNRLFVVRRGDTWRRSLRTTTRMGRDRLRMDVHERVEYEATPLEGKEQDFPDEIIGELRVMRTEKYSSIALVTASEREIVAGDRAVARPGY